MKRKLLSLILVFVLCFSMVGNAYALGSAGEAQAAETRGAITLSCSLSSSRASATIATNVSESLSVRFVLYEIVNGNEIYVTAGSNSGTGVMITASKTVSLDSGTYIMYYSGSGNTISGSDSRTFTL